MEQEYTLEQAVDVLNRAVERKRSEVAALEKRRRRLRKESSIAETEALIAYLEADVTAYITVIADMTDDDSLLEGLDLDRDTVECPTGYDRYIFGLSEEDLENELEADAIRADYCGQVIQDLCRSIGERALKSKKMVKFLWMTRQPPRRWANSSSMTTTFTMHSRPWATSPRARRRKRRRTDDGHQQVRPRVEIHRRRVQKTRSTA